MNYNSLETILSYENNTGYWNIPSASTSTAQAENLYQGTFIIVVNK